MSIGTQPRRRPAASRSLILGALRSDQTFEDFSKRHQVSAAALRRGIRRYLRRKLPKMSGPVRGPVGGKVEIVRDRWGIPHIFAGTATDAYLGFGLAVGQDRLWQLDYRRRHAHGTLAAVLGQSAVPSDRIARTLGFSRVAREEMARHPATTRQLLEAFAAGINFAIELAGDELPAEFEVLGYRPDPWTPLDSVTIARAALWQFSGRIENIVIAEAAQRYLGDLADRFLRVEAPEETIVPSDEGRESLGVSSAPRCRSTAVDGPSSTEPQGSNQWAVGPTRSATGAPLLASDGHVPLTQPSSTYEVHLCADGLDVIGICHRQGVPIIGNGRTRNTAWGITNNVSSIRDLYVEKPNPDRADEVLHGDTFVRLERRVERIDVRDDPSIDLVVHSSPRGPIVNDLIPSVDANGDPPLALRWVGLEPHDSITWGLELVRAASSDEVRKVHRGWRLSGQNPGFADDQGHIGYQMQGGVPRRGRIVRGYRDPHNPLDAWAGLIEFAELPAMADPPRGWIGSANQRPHPPDSPLPLYGAYGDGYRGRRMRALLESSTRHTLADMGRIQNDVYSERAASVKDCLADLLAGDAELAGLARALRRWDCRFAVNSTTASLFATFWWRWTERVAAARFPERLVPLVAGAAGSVAHDLLVEEDFGWFATDPPLPLGEGRGEGSSTHRQESEHSHQTVALEAKRAMREALDWLQQSLGPDRRRWTWGRLHPLTLTHALSSGRPVFAAYFNIGPRPCPGTQGVLNQNGFRIGARFETVSGPHYRFLCDLADPGGAAGTNTAGSSGNPASPHYQDQFDDWLFGRYHRLPMDRADIDSESEGLLTVEGSQMS